jgi:hypothetical protein
MTIKKKKKKGGAHMWSLGIVMLPQVMMMVVMMKRPPRRRVIQALPYKRSLLSSTLHHASRLRPLRYKIMMMDVIMNMTMRVKVTMMMNPLKMN